LINHLFKEQVGGRRPKGLVCKRVTEFLQNANDSVGNKKETLFDYTKEDLNDFRPAESKLKNKIPRFIE
jgi:hypothetical protein